MYKPDKNTQKLKDLIEEEYRVKGYIRWPFIEKFLQELPSRRAYCEVCRVFIDSDTGEREQG